MVDFINAGDLVWCHHDARLRRYLHLGSHHIRDLAAWYVSIDAVIVNMAVSGTTLLAHYRRVSWSLLPGASRQNTQCGQKTSDASHCNTLRQATGDLWPS